MLDHEESKSPGRSKFFSTKSCEAFRAMYPEKICGSQWGFVSEPERGGPASVSEPVMNKQDCTKTAHVEIPFFSSRLL